MPPPATRNTSRTPLLAMGRDVVRQLHQARPPVSPREPKCHASVLSMASSSEMSGTNPISERTRSIDGM